MSTKKTQFIPQHRWRTFKFKRGQNWDGDEEIIHWIEKSILKQPKHLGGFPICRDNWKVTVTVEYDK
jgi:hypothetical protein